MAYISRLFSPAEAAAVIAFATPTLHPSRVVSHNRVASEGVGVETSTDVRSSWSTKVEVSHDSVRHVLQRVCAILGLDPAQAEAAQVVRYEPVGYHACAGAVVFFNPLFFSIGPGRAGCAACFLLPHCNTTSPPHTQIVFVVTVPGAFRLV
jgi:hypothetical protein